MYRWRYGDVDCEICKTNASKFSSSPNDRNALRNKETAFTFPSRTPLLTCPTLRCTQGGNQGSVGLSFVSSVGLAHVSRDEFSFTFSFSVRGVSRVTSAFGCVSVEWSSTESSSVVLSACLSPDVSSVSASGAVVSGVEGTCS